MKVDLFLPDLTSYGVLKGFTRELAQALKRAGHNIRVIDFQKKEDVQKHLASPPEVTLAFNGLLPDVNGLFLYNFTKVPHIALLLDHPERFLPLFSHPATKIGVIDKKHLEWAKKHHQDVFFFPHAVDAQRKVDLTRDRTTDILFPASFVTPLSQEEKIEQAARKEAIEALEGFPLKIVGKGSPSKEELSWDELRKSLETTKLVLQVTPKISDGSHERVLEALNAGALPLSTPNQWLKEEFPSVPQFQSKEELKSWVTRLLSDEAERKRRVKEALPYLNERHTWDIRAHLIESIVKK
ncbi:MAG: glycosyltransferase family 1 protein [Chlamydiia bacterium]|nr:glycosyltransferase family 1 protein [Chlamydiia bacterium]